MQNQKREMSIAECRDSLLMTGLKCRSKYHQRPDRCRYCEFGTDWEVGISCPYRERIARYTLAEHFEIWSGTAFDVFTVAALTDLSKYRAYFGETALFDELDKDEFLQRVSWDKIIRDARKNPEMLMTVDEYQDYQERIRQESTEEAEAERRAGQTE